VGEGERQEEPAGKIAERRSNLARRKIFVVVTTTEVLKFDFRTDSHAFESLIA
jgi:hypothetical protein